MSQALRKLTGRHRQAAKRIVIFINQIREKIGVMFGTPETTTGGRALKFYASVRIDIRRIGADQGRRATSIGNRTKAKVVKNKVAPPFTRGRVRHHVRRGHQPAGRSARPRRRDQLPQALGHVDQLRRDAPGPRS
jgi:recombination protein RecA